MQRIINNYNNVNFMLIQTSSGGSHKLYFLSIQLNCCLTSESELHLSCRFNSSISRTELACSMNINIIIMFRIDLSLMTKICEISTKSVAMVMTFIL